MNKQAIQIMVDYVEGRISVNDVRKEIETNKVLIKLLKRELKLEYLQHYKYNLYNYFKLQYQYIKNWDIIYVRNDLQFNLCKFLEYYNIPFKKYAKYREDYLILLDIEPSWLEGVNDEGIMDKIIEGMPKELSKTKRIQWGKERIKEIFKCDKSYPRWIQGSEWPIVNGKPLVFSHQSKEQKDDERIYFYFYDPDTGKQTVVEQFY